MRKVFLLSAVLSVLFFMTETSYAAKICLLDNFGSYWELKGGKIDKKSYTTKHILPGCVVGGYADVTLTNLGQLVVTFYDAHDTTGACQVVYWTAVTNLGFGGSGTYDIWGDGTKEGNFSVTPVSCSTLPPSLTNKPAAVNPNHPSLKK
jgi:hypothetical protein